MNKNKWILMALCLCASGSASAAGNETRTNPCHYYKWYDKGIAHYGRSVPRHIEQEGICYRVARSGYGLEIDNLGDLESYAVFQGDGSMRPSAAGEAVTEESSQHNPYAAPVEGTISRAERCRTARAQIKLLTEKNTVYEDDGAGNLIPLTKEQIAERLATAQHNEALLCSGE